MTDEAKPTEINVENLNLADEFAQYQAKIVAKKLEEEEKKAKEEEAALKE